MIHGAHRNKIPSLASRRFFWLGCCLVLRCPIPQTPLATPGLLPPLCLHNSPGTRTAHRRASGRYGHGACGSAKQDTHRSLRSPAQLKKRNSGPKLREMAHLPKLRSITPEVIQRRTRTQQCAWVGMAAIQNAKGWIAWWYTTVVCVRNRGDH